MTRALVTGGAGFIGSHIVDLLMKEGLEPIVVDNLSTGKKGNIPSNIKLYDVDISSNELDMIFSQEKPDYVIHQAAQVNVRQSVTNPAFDAVNNIIGTINLLMCSQKYQVKKVVYASSCAVYGETGDVDITESYPIQPISFYGLSKFAPEMYIKLFSNLYKLPYTILRYANVYGPRQNIKGETGVVAIFIEKLLKDEIPVIFGNGKQTRDFVYVKDVAKANLLAISQGVNETINISTNQKTSINKIYERICYMLGKNISPIYLPSQKGDIEFSRLSSTKASQILNWKPAYELDEGLKETVYYYSSLK